MLAVQGSIALAATLFAWRAFFGGHSYFQTDRWDNVCAWSQAAAAVTGTYVLNGTASPTWLAVGVVLAYASTLMVGISGWFFIAAVTAGAIGSATVND